MMSMGKTKRVSMFGMNGEIKAGRKKATEIVACVVISFHYISGMKINIQ